MYRHVARKPLRRGEFVYVPDFRGRKFVLRRMKVVEHNAYHAHDPFAPKVIKYAWLNPGIGHGVSFDECARTKHEALRTCLWESVVNYEKRMRTHYAMWHYGND